MRGGAAAAPDEAHHCEIRLTSPLVLLTLLLPVPASIRVRRQARAAHLRQRARSASRRRPTVTIMRAVQAVMTSVRRSTMMMMTASMPLTHQLLRSRPLRRRRLAWRSSADAVPADLLPAQLHQLLQRLTAAVAM